MMKKRYATGFTGLFAFIIALSVCVSAGAEQPLYNPNATLRFHSGERFIHDQYGRVVIFRGANLGTCYHREGIGYDNEDLAALKSYGFNFIRLNLGWDIIEPENGHFDEERMKTLRKFIVSAQEYGLYTMPDFHQMLWEAHIPRWMRDESLGHDHLSEMSPVAAAQSARFWESEQLQGELIEFLVFMAEQFKGAEGLFGYDLFNEPFSMKGTSYSVFEKCCLFPFYEKAIEAVRDVDPETPIILEPHPQSVVLPAFTRPFEYSNIVYSPHVYFPHDYGPNGLRILNEETPADVRLKYQRFQKDAEKMETPWIVGEYGGDPENYPFAVDWLLENMRMQERYFVGSAIWSYSAGGGGGWSINSKEGTLNPGHKVNFMRPYPQYTAGRPDKMQYDAAGKRFRFRFFADSSIDAPTEIFYPREIMKISGVSFVTECSVEWAYDEENALLKMRTPCDMPVEVRVAPK